MRCGGVPITCDPPYTNPPPPLAGALTAAAGELRGTVPDCGSWRTWCGRLARTRLCPPRRLDAVPLACPCWAWGLSLPPTSRTGPRVPPAACRAVEQLPR